MAAGESMAQRMVWVDLEMTGLDIEKDQIIEMACLITDSDLNILAEGPNLIIKQPDELLDSMSDWCKEHHGKSGLTKAVKESTMTLQQAEYEFLSFVRQQTPPGLCPLAGHWTTLAKASENFSFTEITSSRRKQTRRRGKSWKTGRTGRLRVDAGARAATTRVPGSGPGGFVHADCLAGTSSPLPRTSRLLKQTAPEILLFP